MSTPITVTENVYSRSTTCERSYTYEELLDIFTSNGNVVRPLVLRCQEYEAEIERLRKAANPECPGCGLRPCLENGATVWCDECVSQLRSLIETAVDAFESGTNVTHEPVTGQYWHGIRGIVSRDWLAKAKEVLGE